MVRLRATEGLRVDREYVREGRQQKKKTATAVRGVSTRPTLVTGSPFSIGRHRPLCHVVIEGTVPGRQTFRSEKLLRGRPRRLFKNGLDPLVGILGRAAEGVDGGEPVEDVGISVW